MTRRSIVILVSLLAVAPVLASAQTEVDATLSKVAGQVITRGDVWRARTLKLTDAPDTEADVLIALENRKLVLLEAVRSPDVATAADRATRRRDWEARHNGAANASAKLTEAGMSEATLMKWFDEDIRIDRYEEQLFAGAPDRPEKVAAWLETLRKRAGLRVK